MSRRVDSAGVVDPNAGIIPAVHPISPSLVWPTSAAASFELKFLLEPDQAAHVLAWAGQHLAVDPHADPALGDAYKIHSVYFDTRQLDVLHRTPTFKRRKFRLRRYGDEDSVYLERKTKSGDRVAKRRTVIAGHELIRLEETFADPSWPGYWYHRTLLARGLQPRCLLSYERIAHVGMSSDGPMRLTLDRNIHCALTNGRHFDSDYAGIPLLADRMVLELKFRATLPVLFKRLIQEMRLNPSSVSKYRLGMTKFQGVGRCRSG
ncbi:MAG TPA: polyphosphate polymerase domain-containing protein [Gemmataceae bacterium]|nr:polyphosphate polymerase domain-containing protein [Gemmataceae bacterium]